MAERRMFAKTIVLSDAFLDMPLGARCLYMTMSMLADDDGFVNAPKSIMRQCGASDDDLKILLAKKFVIPFESGIVVIKHWRINNYLQNDRIQPTKYQDEFAELEIEENGAYRRLNEPKQAPVPIANKPSNPNLFRDFANGDEELYSALREFEMMRNRIKKPMTDGAKKRLMTKLKTFPREDWIGILNRSIDHCWQGLYPLKKEETNNIFLGMLGEQNG